MAIVSVSGLSNSSGKKNEVRDSVENLLVDLALGDDSSLRQHTPLYAKLSVTDILVEATQVLALNDFALNAGSKIAFSIALTKTIEGSLADVTALYATKKTIAGLGNEAVLLTDSDLSTTALRDLDKKTSGAIDIAALETLRGSLTDMTAVLKSKGIAGLANATLVLEQTAPLTAKNLKALTALATQAGTLENVDVDVSGALATLEGTLKDVSAVLTAEGLTGLNGIDVTITDTKLTTEALAALTALTDGNITASKLKTLTGDAASVAALYEANVAGLDSVNITLSDASLDAAELNAILAATAGKITASKLKTLSGSLEDILEALDTPKTQIASLASKAIILGDNELDASQLLALNALSKGLIDAGNLSLLTGSAADIRTALTTSVKEISGMGSQNVSVDDDASVAELNSIDAATNGVISASISGSAATLVGLNTGDNEYAITITDAASLAQLTRIAAATSLDLDYSAIRDSAAALVGDGSAPSEWLAGDVTVTVTDTATTAQLDAIAAAIGDGELSYSALTGSAEELIGDGSEPSNWLADGVTVNLTGSATIEQLDAIAAISGEAALTYLSVSGSAADLAGDGSAASPRLIEGVSVTVTDTATPAQLNAIAAAIGDGELTYPGLTGSADELLGDGSEPSIWLADGVTVTLTGSATIEQLDAIAGAIGDGELTYSALTGSAEELIGDGSQPSSWLADGVAVALTGSATIEQLDGIAAAIGDGELSYSALTGSAEELIGDGSQPSIWLADGVAVSLTGSATIEQLDAIAAITGEAALTYLSVSGSAAELAGDGSAASPRLIEGVAVTVTDTATPAQLAAITDAIGDGELSYSALIGSAGELVGDGSEPSIWLVEGLTVTLTGTASNAQLVAIADAIGSGTLIYGGLNAVITNGMDFSTNYTGTAGVFLTGSDGNQTATGSVYDDVIQGGDGNDTLRGNDGNDQLYGGSGADTLFGGAGDDILYGGEDVTQDGVQDSFVYLPGFSQGNDTIVGFEPGVDRIILSGGNFADVQISDEGADAIITLTHTNADVTTIRLLDRAGQINPTDIVTLGTPGDDTLNGTAGDDVLSGQGGKDTLYGLAGDDVLFGGAGDDYLHGGDGNDILYGGAGSDILIGGAGDDILIGGDAGPNPQPDGVQNSFVYLPGFGQGNDTIHGFQPGLDRIILSGGNFADVQISDEGADAIITLTHTNADVTTIRLLDRAGQINPTDIVTLGTPGDDTLNGTAGDDVLSGQGGNDTLYGLAGDDVLFGGAGDDALHGGEGNDILYGGAGGDTLIGGLGDDIMFGGDNSQPDGARNLFVYNPDIGQGNDTIYGFQPGLDQIVLTGAPVAHVHIADNGDDAIVTLTHANDDVTTIRLVDRAGRIGLTDIVIYGTADNDVLYGNAADNVIHGREGNDTLYGGAGNDTLFGGLGDDVLHGGGSDANGGYDAFLYDHRVGQGNDIITDFIPGRDKIALLGGAVEFDIGVDGQDALVTLIHPNAEITTIRLPGLAGQIQTSDISITGNGADDVLHGDDADNTLDGQGGDDVIHGGAGSDIIIGGLGNDILYGGVDETDDGAQDSFVYDYRFGQGSDTIHGFTPAQDKIVLLGGAAKDIQIAIDGADALVTLTHANDETTSIRLVDRAGLITLADFVISGTPGNDVLYGTSGNDTLVGQAGDDILVGGAGADVLLGGAGNDTVSYHTSSAGVSVNLSAPFLNSGGDAQGDWIQNVENVTGSAFDDVLTGNAQANILDGGAGNDTLNGGDGDDTLYGGTGNDTLIGGLGSDILTGGTVNEGGYNAFLYEHHYGQDQDTITDFVPGRDKIVLMGGAAKHIQIDTDGADAMVTITHSDDQLTQIRLLDQAELITLADFSISGRAGDDLLIGSDGRDVILGQAGEDEIIGMGGGDVLYGGADSDTFIYLQASDSVFVTGFIDLIMDFELGPEGDVIDLTALNLDSTSYSWSTAATTLAASQSASAAFAAGHGIHAVVIGDDTYLFADADGSQVMAAGDLAIRLVGFTDAQTLALHLEA